MSERDPARTERQLAELRRRMPLVDKTARDLGAHTYEGSIEDIEERQGPPWLRRRRREQRRLRGE